MISAPQDPTMRPVLTRPSARSHRPWLFGAAFVADRRHPFADPATVEALRAEFVSDQRPALVRLIRRRYDWMNRFIPEHAVGLEVGCGPGLSKLFIRSRNF